MSTATKRRRGAPAAPLADEGVVVAVAAVTGIEDSVGDIIAPGAFLKTLKKLRPKLCFNHAWSDPLGSVLHIIELMPGDARLPKKLPDGRPWPREAGAVLATLQYHLTTERGREMFAHTKEWAKRGEAAFSIGYKVVPGRASKRADGVRVIYELDLYEVSLVLHGAHNMALALEVKAAADGPDLETTAPVAGMVEVHDQPDFTSSAMVALYPSPDAARAIAVDGGSPVDDLHVTLAFLGDAAAVDGADLAARLAPALAGTGPLSGTVGGLGTFPAGDNGTPVWAPVDVPGLDRLRVAVTDALDDAGHPQQSEHGFTPHMTLGYDLVSVSPVEDTPVEFTEAYVVTGGDRFPIPLAGAPAMEGKAAMVVAAARSVPILESKTAAAVVLEAKSLPPAPEVKSMRNAMSGSYEELREKLSQAVDTLFAATAKGGSDGTVAADGHSYIEATFPTEVVVNVCDYSKSPEERDQTYVVPYTVTADGKIELGTPEEARIEVTLSDAAPDSDGDAPVVMGEEALGARFTLPLVSVLDEATTLAAMAPEGKSLVESVRPALERLLDQLAAKNLPYSADPAGGDEDDDFDWDALAAELDGDDPDDGDEDDEDMDLPDGEDGTETKAGAGEPVTDEEDDVPLTGPADDTVLLDPAEVDADMAELEDTPAEDDESLT